MRNGLLQSHARIGQRVTDVGDEVHDHHHDREEHGEAADHRQVARHDRIDQQAAETGHREDLLDHHGAADDPADPHPDDRDRRDQAVGQHVTEEHLRPAQPLGSGGIDVIGLQRVDQRGAQALLDQRRGRQPDDERGQKQPVEVFPHPLPDAAGREPAKPEREPQDQHIAQPERRHRDQCDEDVPDRAVDHRAASERRENGKGQRHCQRDQRRIGDDREGEGQPLGHQPDHRHLVEDRHAEAAGQAVAQEIEVLHPERLIEAPELAHGGKLLGARPGAHGARGRIARHHLQQQEAEQRDADQHRDQHHEPFENDLEHRPSAGWKMPAPGRRRARTGATQAAPAGDHFAIVTSSSRKFEVGSTEKPFT
ncbi:hypothetical protein SDC9_37166 [bioreactor metagenome]|uniref:Uncharacterized protein n=1 Tax=bioreactor metagenome TaxID=1076179 RepID=A0A644VKI0_9ZZZZ